MNVDELTLRHQIIQLEYKTECQKIENDLLQAEVERLRAELDEANEKIKSQQQILQWYKTGKGVAMNVDEAMRCVSDGQNSSRDGYAVLFNLEVGTTLKAEVERLRAELELSKANAESLKKALHEVQNAAIRLGDQVDDAKAELAAAKAASAIPVNIEDLRAKASEPGEWGHRIEFYVADEEDVVKALCWLQFCKNERNK